MKNEGKKPIDHIRVADCSLSVWENESDKGNKFYSFAFQRSYNVNYGTDKKPEFKNVQSYTINDLWKIATLCSEAQKKFGIKQAE